MNYGVKELSKLSGVSGRTLRYYDQIGLLHPQSRGTNDYRVYGPAEAERLRAILAYRAMEVPLETVSALLDASEAERARLLEAHLQGLRAREKQLHTLAAQVEKTLLNAKGEDTMPNFDELKEQAIRENEAAYGAEVAQRWGEDTAKKSREKHRNMSRETWDQGQAMEEEIVALLRQAMTEGNPAGETAHRLCECHGAWLRLHWPEGMYTAEAHRALGETYTQDERFTRYYDDRAGEGAAAFLCAALQACL